MLKNNSSNKYLLQIQNLIKQFRGDVLVVDLVRLL